MPQITHFAVTGSLLTGMIDYVELRNFLMSNYTAQYIPQVTHYAGNW